MRDRFPHGSRTSKHSVGLPGQCLVPSALKRKRRMEEAAAQALCDRLGRDRLYQMIVSAIATPLQKQAAISALATVALA